MAKKVWVDPNGNALSFLRKRKSASAPVREAKSKQERVAREQATNQENLAKQRQRELEELAHETDKTARSLEIEKLKRAIRDSQEDLRAAAASAVPQEDPRVAKKRTLRAELERLRQEKAEEIKKIIGDTPEPDWTDDMRWEVTRIQNSYDNAIHSKSEELEPYL